MPDVVQYEASEGQCAFRRWFFRLEARAAARVTRVVAKLESGLRPDVKPAGQGVMKARIDYGPGYRVYFGLDGKTLVILLGGGTNAPRTRISGTHKRAGPTTRPADAGKNDGPHPQLP